MYMYKHTEYMYNHVYVYIYQEYESFCGFACTYFAYNFLTLPRKVMVLIRTAYHLSVGSD